MFGDVRVDNYYWVRDDSRTSPEVLSYLQQENAYTDSVLSGQSLGGVPLRTYYVISLLVLEKKVWSFNVKRERTWDSVLNCEINRVLIFGLSSFFDVLSIDN